MNTDTLRRIGACTEAVDWCATQPDAETAWGACLDGRWMIWLLVRLDRRRGVGVLVEVVRAMFAHLAPDEVTIEVLNPLAAWAAGDDTIDLAAVRKRARDLWLSAYTTAADADAAAAAYAADAYAAAYAADAAAAAAHATDARAAAAAATAADADAAADMIRDLVPYGEVKKMMREVKP